MCHTLQNTTRRQYPDGPNFPPLLDLIASATDPELAKYVEYLKHENKIFRAWIPGQIHTTMRESGSLLKYGKPVDQTIHELITIVSPSTFLKWVREANESKPKSATPKGGKRKPRELREFVIEIAKPTGFGYTRIIRELRKLGIKDVSHQTVRNILKEQGGGEPGPDCTSDSLTDFLNRHGETFWSCDFFSAESMTTRGMHDLYVLVFPKHATPGSHHVGGQSGSPSRLRKGTKSLQSSCKSLVRSSYVNFMKRRSRKE